MRIKRLLLQVDANVDNEPNIVELNSGGPKNGYLVVTNNPNSWPRGLAPAPRLTRGQQPPLPPAARGICCGPLVVPPSSPALPVAVFGGRPKGRIPSSSPPPDGGRRRRAGWRGAYSWIVRTCPLQSCGLKVSKLETGWHMEYTGLTRPGRAISIAWPVASYSHARWAAVHG